MCMGILALFAAGGGDGSNVPGLLFFAPAAALWTFMGGDSRVPVFVVFGMVFLYSSYGVILNVGRRFQRGMPALGLVLGIHYASVAAVCGFAPARFNLADSSGMSYFLQGFGLVFAAAFGMCFAMLHVLAYQYARSERPYRPLLARGFVACAGFVATVVICALVIMWS